jgi:hypothetical protein
MNKSKVYSLVSTGYKPSYAPYTSKGKQYIILYKNYNDAPQRVILDQYQRAIERFDDYKNLSRRLDEGKTDAYEDMIQRNLKPKNKDVKNYINLILQYKQPEEKAILKFITLDGEIKYMTLTEENKHKYMAYLTDAFEQKKRETYGSDTIDNYIIDGFEKITHEYLAVSDKQKNKADNDSGHYFNATNKTDIDLTQYQIFKEEYFKAIEEKRKQGGKDKFYEEQIKHCIIHTLEAAGIEPVKVQRILSSFEDCFNFPVSKLQKLAEAIDRSIFLYTYDINNDIRCKKYIVENKEPINMGLYKNHYFIINDTKYTKYSIDHYEEIKHMVNFNDIYLILKSGRVMRSKERSKLNSLELIKKMNDLKMFEWSNKTLLNYRVEAITDNVLDIPLDDIENEQKLSDDYKKREPCDIYIADLESIVKDGTHKPFMSGIIKKPKTKEEKKKFKTPWITVSKTPDCTKWFFNMLWYVINNTFPKPKEGEEEKKIEDPVIYFHNLKYDLTIMIKHLCPRSSTKKDGQYYETRIFFAGHYIKLRDSYKMISAPLKKFNKMFQLKNKKEEAINYAYYDYDNLSKKNNVKNYRKGLTKKDKIKFDNIMANNAEQFEYTGKTFNALGFYIYYLKQDVMTLYEGLEKFNSEMFILTKGLNSYDFLTISSLASRYFNSQGCFDGVMMCCGNLRSYLGHAVYGGRVNVQQTIKKIMINEILNDYDANSLYPSAFFRMCEEGTGLSKGKAKVIKEEHKIYENIEKEEYYVVTVEITAINKKQDNPFIQIRNKDGISDYINDLPNGEPIITTIDKITLEDYKKFHEIEFKILKGVYYNEGFNNSIGPECKRLYEERRRIKDENPVMGDLIKLILNSTYGKTISKKSFDKVNYVKADDFENFVYKNYANIKGMIHKINDKFYEITTATIDDSYNFASVGIKCLSFSKRIMNEVMGLASDNGILIYYQDTDSMHLKDCDIPKLEELYRKNYNGKELHGSGLGQFKSDFKFTDENGDDLKYTSVKSIRSCFLGKKAYIDELRGYDKEGIEHIDYHIRLKGVTEAGINYEVKLQKGAMKLYERLAAGEEITFILNPTKEKVMFDFTRNTVITRETGSFERVVSF